MDVDDAVIYMYVYILPWHFSLWGIAKSMKQHVLPAVLALGYSVPGGRTLLF